MRASVDSTINVALCKEEQVGSSFRVLNNVLRHFKHDSVTLPLLPSQFQTNLFIVHTIYIAQAAAQQKPQSAEQQRSSQQQRSGSSKHSASSQLAAAAICVYIYIYIYVGHGVLSRDL